MFLLDLGEQGSVRYGTTVEAVFALCDEIIRRRDEHMVDAAGDEDVLEQWHRHIFRADGMRRSSLDGARRLDEPIVFDLPNGECLTLRWVDR